MAVDVPTSLQLKPVVRSVTPKGMLFDPPPKSGVAAKVGVPP